MGGYVGYRIAACFHGAGEWCAKRAAEKWCADRGYSIGRQQKGSPRGLLRGDYDIQKWRNLRPRDRAALDGLMSGDMRNGPVRVHLRHGQEATASPAAGEAER